MLIGGCPLCMEGKSRGKKRRARYFPDRNFFFCHNDCGSMSPYQWIKQVTGWSYQQIVEDVTNTCGTTLMESLDEQQFMCATNQQPALPVNSINLEDNQQVKFYSNKSNFYKTKLTSAKQFIHQRRWDSAAHKPETYYMSFDDPVHRGRIVIPYYSEHGIECYQSRSFDGETPKYLSKLDSNKYPFNACRIRSEPGHYLVMEGAADAMFVDNTVAIGGLTMTEYQQQILGPYDMMLQRIWVLDNPFIDKAAHEKYIKLIQRGETVFVWPGPLRDIKDIGQYAMDRGIDELPLQVFIKGSAKGDSARLQLI